MAARQQKIGNLIGIGGLLVILLGGFLTLYGTVVTHDNAIDSLKKEVEKKATVEFVLVLDKKIDELKQGQDKIMENQNEILLILSKKDK